MAKRGRKRRTGRKTKRNAAKRARTLLANPVRKRKAKMARKKTHRRKKNAPRRSHKRRSHKRRSNPSPRRSHKRRSHKRRRNPSGGMVASAKKKRYGAAALGLGVGVGGGLLVNLGLNFLPIPAIAKTIIRGIGAIGAIALAPVSLPAAVGVSVSFGLPAARDVLRMVVPQLPIGDVAMMPGPDSMGQVLPNGPTRQRLGMGAVDQMGDFDGMDAVDD